MTNWQEVLLALPTQLGWIWTLTIGLISLAAAAIMFLAMILHHEFSALLVSRVVLGLGLLLQALTVLQPGWQPYANACYAVGGLLSSSLIATGWCTREDQSVPMWRAIVGWLCSRVGGVLTYIAGGVDHRRREDAL